MQQKSSAKLEKMLYDVGAKKQVIKCEGLTLLTVYNHYCIGKDGDEAHGTKELLRHKGLEATP